MAAKTQGQQTGLAKRALYQKMAKTRTGSTLVKVLEAWDVYGNARDVGEELGRSTYWADGKLIQAFAMMAKVGPTMVRIRR